MWSSGAFIGKNNLFCGMKMKSRNSLLGVTALALMALMISTAYATCKPPGLSPGYWKHNVHVYCGGNGSYSGDPVHETDESMEGYELIIKGWYAPFTLEWADEHFQDNKLKNGPPYSWLDIANAFNRASGRADYGY
jgi:hypothetical protein